MTERIAYWDGLRGWAAVAVVLYHLDQHLVPSLHAPPALAADGLADDAPLRLFFSFVAEGRLAVAIFFVLSGIVLSAAVSDRRTRAGEPGGPPKPTFAGLAAKRYLRLALPMLGSTLLGLLAFTVFTGSDFLRLGILTGHDESVLSTCAACVTPTLSGALLEGLWSTFVGYSPEYNRVLWTIYIEFIGSLLVFLLILGPPSPVLRRVVAAAIFMVVGTAFIGSFFLGVLINEFAPMLAHRLQTSRSRGPGMATDAVGILAAVIGLGWRGLIPAWAPIAHMAASVEQALTTAGWIISPEIVRADLVVVGCAISPSLQRLLSLRSSVFLGRISFSLYLTHFPIFMIAVFPLFLHIVHVGMDVTVPALALAAVAVGLALAVAVAYEVAVERPAVALSGRVGGFLDRLWARCMQRYARGRVQPAP
jgi:peptidoglycan/LPS O-acetylase OafA/YrhL